MTKNIMLVDDHPVFSYGLAQVINANDKFSVCAQCENAGNALQQIHKIHPDLVVTDITLEGRNGIDLISEIKRNWPAMLILVVSMHDESLYAPRAFRAGASGYVQKDERPSVIVKAICHLLNGMQYWTEFDPNTLGSEEQKSHFTQLEELLTNREFEIFQLMAKGYKPKKISDILHLSINTIETHRAHIKNKLNLTSSNEVYTYAIECNKKLL